VLNADIIGLLVAGGLDPVQVEDVCVRALAEDIDGGVDLTSVATVSFDAEGTATFVPRAPGMVCGLPVAAAVMLSGIATLTRRWVDAVAGSGAVIRDTRKTTPGLRALEKYAVRCGGGTNHRMSLSDEALIKDNHVLAAGGVAQAYRTVRATFPDVVVQVECDTVEQVQQAVDAGAKLLLLDNMEVEQLKAAVAIARLAGARTEASGGLTLDRAPAVAATGVDFLAVGALTHSAPVLDIGLDLEGR
jgi:nicotinate-nucleotide pyrophosphorylase (carboxylating)